MRGVILAIVAIITITGCSSMKVADFKDQTPKFVPSEYFNGPLTAYGMVKSRSGEVTRRFKGELFGSWDANGTGTLEEHFVYDDGETQERIWTLVPQEDGSYLGTAGDIVGQAPLTFAGNTVMMDYTMTITYNGSPLNIDVKDWLHLQEDGVILNHSIMRKFGFKVGELVITIIKDFPQKD